MICLEQATKVLFIMFLVGRHGRNIIDLVAEVILHGSDEAGHVMRQLGAVGDDLQYGTW